MEKLSVVIITFNEERNIRKCLESVVDISDDIIVLDSFSTDKTEDICGEYTNVRFVQNKWMGYSKTKNHANRLAKYDYILSLDADEVLSEDLKASIAGIEKLEGVYEFSRLTNYCGKWVKHCGWYPDKKVRIFSKEGVFWEGDFVHETLHIPPAMDITLLKGDLFHYSYHSIEDHYNQIEKYSDLHAQKMLNQGKRAPWLKRNISPAFKFIRTYFLQLGILDGEAGFTISRISAKAVRLKYQKLNELNRQSL